MVTDRWLKPNDKGVAKEYLLGVFELENTGDISAPIHSQFGLHIIRLDELKPGYHRPFEEVKPAILRDLEGQYRAQALRVYSDSFNVGEDLKLNVEKLDEIFAPYMNAESEG